MGCIHIYTGDGKGKTTAAIGSCIRFVGNQGSVLFTQFLKSGTSSELNILSTIPSIIVLPCTKYFGFSFQMTDAVKKEAHSFYTDHLKAIIQQVNIHNPGLLVLDEIIGAYNQELIDRDVLLNFLRNKPEGLEVILTGRNADTTLIALGDYVSEIKKIKHPFDHGVLARYGIEK